MMILERNVLTRCCYLAVFHSLWGGVELVEIIYSDSLGDI